MPVEPQPCGSGAAGDGGPDVEQTIVCDVLPDGTVVGAALAVYEYDTSGNPTGPPTFVDPATGLPYVPQGTLQPCREGCCPEPVALCDIQADGSSVQFIRTFTGQNDGGLTVTDQLLDGSVYAPTGTVGSCEPYTTCTPSSDQDLNALCGPGESPDQTVVAADDAHPLANAVYVDDASADPLCGGQWDRPSAPLVAPFPVNESFRNTTFDQPGPVLQGTAPYPDLTADTDGAGAGWLQVADINSGTNGLWQVPSPFPTSQGMNAGITFASHDGTVPGGDGMAFVFTDGSVPAQSIPVGGFGNLGLQNWQGGYVAVVLDEYGQTCTCSHAAQGVIDPNPGPCGFCTNTISIQLAGAARQTASCACCTVASLPLAPKALNQTTRSTPARLLTSIIEEGGQTYVSASIDWNDGNGVIQYFDRVNVTACAGPPPPTLRMAAYGGSGGSYRAVKEMRDATARPAGVSNWRAFPITTDAIPACTSLVNIKACVDVTFNNDTQTTANSDPEAYLLLVDTQTNTVLDRAVQSSIPSQVGNPNQLCVQEAVAPAKIPFLRVYVGAEGRDQAGEYDQLWENLEITATGTGCPAQPRRTLEVSARCPLPVAIVSGGAGDGGGGGTTVVNTPATFEDAPVCMTIGGVEQSGYRREVRAPDGTNTVTFLGVDGLPVTPETWTPGPCCCDDTELVELCDRQANGVLTPFLRRIVFDGTGGVVSSEDVDPDGNPYTPTGFVTTCSAGDLDVEHLVLCDDNGPFIRAILYAPGQGGFAVGSHDWQMDGVTTYTPVGTVRQCDACTPTVLGAVCVTSTDFPGVILPATAVQACDGTVTYLNANTGDPWPNTTGVVVCPPDNAAWEEILCDQGNAGQPFRRVYNLTPLGSVVTYDEDLDGNPYAVVGPAVLCVTDEPGRDVEQVVLCDSNGPFIRVYQYGDDTGTPSGAPADYTLAGAPYVPVGPVSRCSDAAGAELDLSESLWCVGALPAIRHVVRNETAATETVTWLRPDGTVFVPTAPQLSAAFPGSCSTPVTDLDFFVLELCDNNGAFLRRLTFSSTTGAVTTTTNTTLAGAAYVPVGTVGICDGCCPQVVGNGCTTTGSGFYTAIRSTSGTISLIDSVTGAAVLAANIIPCPSDNTVVTASAEARLIADADAPWTPGADVVGVLTSVTLTVLSGTANVVDASGTVLNGLPAGLTLSWNVEDNNVLTGLQSIDAIGGQTVVNWTRR